jgi:hypothetical protein
LDDRETEGGALEGRKTEDGDGAAAEFGVQEATEEPRMDKKRGEFTGCRVTKQPLLIDPGASWRVPFFTPFEKWSFSGVFKTLWGDSGGVSFKEERAFMHIPSNKVDTISLNDASYRSQNSIQQAGNQTWQRLSELTWAPRIRVLP